MGAAVALTQVAGTSVVDTLVVGSMGCTNTVDFLSI